MFDKDEAPAECPGCRDEAQTLADKHGIPVDKAYDQIWFLSHRWAGM
jgi:hypothetical protein